MAHYYSWRSMQYALSGFAAVCWLCTLFLQPETSQPGARGIDKARAEGKKDRFVWLNPLNSLGLMRSPNVLFLVSCFPPKSFERSLTNAPGYRGSACALD